MFKRIVILPLLVLSFGCALPIEEIPAVGVVACWTTDFIDKEICMDVDRLHEVRDSESMATKRSSANIGPDLDADFFPHRSYGHFLPYYLQQRKNKWAPKTIMFSHTGNKALKRAFDSIEYYRSFGGFGK